MVPLTLTLIFIFGVRGVYDSFASNSRFFVCISLPINDMKCVLRWRRNNVFADGMESKLARRSAVKAGSKTCGKI
jgi:hypothetical protein